MSHHRNFGIPSRHEFGTHPVYRPAPLALIVSAALWAAIVAMILMLVSHI